MYDDMANGATSVVDVGVTATGLDTDDISCADARAEVRSVLAEVCSGLPQDRVQRLRDDALLVVSELVTNALLHAGAVTRFSARLVGDELLLRVGDSSGDVPRTRASAPGSPGGHGWKIVQRLCARVQVDREPDGKTVTAVLALA